MLTHRANVIIGVAATAFVAFAYWRLADADAGAPASPPFIDGFALAAFSVFACLSTTAAARVSLGSRRRSWAALAVGVAGWVVGNLIWLYFGVVFAGGPPFPSIADAGFLLLPVAVVFAALSEVSASRISALRPVLDGVIIAAALFLVSWVLVLRDAFMSATSGLLANAVQVAFPISDVVMVTMTLVALSAAPVGGRRAIGLVGVGLTAIALADSAWIYTRTQGGSVNAGIVIGWTAGMLIIGVGGLIDASRRPPPVLQNQQNLHRPVSERLLWLPCTPVVLAVAVGFVSLWPVPGAAPILISAAVLVLAALARQFVVLIDNRRLMRTVAEQARRDPLTGLGNRLLFNDRLDSAMRARENDGLPVAVLALDLDDFKMVNDNLGHPSGDELLVEVANRLTGSVHAGQAVARLGGDEFAILIRSAPCRLEEIAQDVIEAFDVPFTLKGEEVFMHPSVGLAIADDDLDVTADDLLQRADVALYVAKRAGIGGVQTFSPDMQQDTAVEPGERWSDSGRVRLSASSGLQLLGPLRRAITHGELKLTYQPKVSMSTGKTVGVEALMRWPHPQLGLLTPAHFLPLVRRNGLIGAVTDLVLHQAARDAAAWFQAGHRDVPVAINLFAPSLSDITLADRIGSVLAEHALPTDALLVEITEHLLLANVNRTHAVINQLRESGLRVSIDDFGTGYSSMSYLRDLPVDELKLDRQFIAPILHNPRAAAIVRSVIDLTRALDIVSVAEGVENTATAERLTAYGCDVAQGYYFAKPMFADELRALLNTHEALWHPRARGETTDRLTPSPTPRG
ncbi:putative bifunctional diguanylate cyclase/phosphodiesterase [Mycobacterium sp. MAA66]|uniref:putative bifunctional diguanylate cyclase/phosphodiesterase n=1 Tax=Mycobacterium sp. MAA66 TaxID=3156297 RepID=UPI0035161EB7